MSIRPRQAKSDWDLASDVLAHVNNPLGVAGISPVSA